MVTRTVSSADQRYLRRLSGPLGGAHLGVAEHDRVDVSTDHPHGILEGLTLGRRRGPGGVLRAEHLPTQAMHRRPERKPRPRARLVEVVIQQPPLLRTGTPAGS